jgi:hypothetical protein
MQAPHRRKKKKTIPIWSYMRNIRSLLLEADSGVYGFTLSGEFLIKYLNLKCEGGDHNEFHCANI